MGSPQLWSLRAAAAIPSADIISRAHDVLISECRRGRCQLHIAVVSSALKILLVIIELDTYSTVDRYAMVIVNAMCVRRNRLVDMDVARGQMSSPGFVFY